VPGGTRYFGTYEHSIDAKGRLTLPKKLRVHFPELVYVTPHLEGCLAVWAPEEFEHEVEQQLELSDRDPRARNAVREWSARVFDLAIDAQNRIALPTELRAAAELGQEVLVNGMINRVEVWSRSRWEHKDEMVDPVEIGAR
jgi:MraZ protein